MKAVFTQKHLPLPSFLNPDLSYVLDVNDGYLNDTYTFTLNTLPNRLEPDQSDTATFPEKSWWLLRGRAGQVVDISLNSTSSIDPFLSVYNITNTLIISDDDRGPSLNAEISNLVLNEQAYYVQVQINDVDGWSVSAPYTLSVTNKSLPVLPIDERIIVDLSETNTWQFRGEAKQKFQLEASLLRPSSPQTNTFTLYNPQGLAIMSYKSLYEEDMPDFVLPETGDYVLQAKPGSYGPLIYQLRILLSGREE